MSDRFELKEKNKSIGSRGPFHAMWPTVAASSGRIIATTATLWGNTLLPHLSCDLVSSIPAIILPLWIIQFFTQHIDKRDFYQAVSNAASRTLDFNCVQQPFSGQNLLAVVERWPLQGNF